MDLDKFKENWKKNDDGNELPYNITKLRSSMHPLDKLKSNMRQELYTQVLAFAFVAFVPCWADFSRTSIVIFYITYIVFFIIAAYYMATFFRFYSKLQKYSGTAKKTLSEIYVDLRLNVERYKAFGFLLAPFFIAWLLLYLNDKMQRRNQSLSNLSEQNIIVLFLIIIVAISATMTLVVFWTNLNYGKYAKQIKSILDELDE